MKKFRLPSPLNVKEEGQGANYRLSEPDFFEKMGCLKEADPQKYDLIMRSYLSKSARERIVMRRSAMVRELSVNCV